MNLYERDLLMTPGDWLMLALACGLAAIVLYAIAQAIRHERRCQKCEHHRRLAHFTTGKWTCADCGITFETKAQA